MSVLSCLRAGTGVHVAWVVEPAGADPHEAVAITPGGGRMGNLMGGALDNAIREAVHGLDEGGKLVAVPLGPLEAILTGRAEGTTVTLAVVAGGALPAEVWENLVARKPTRFALRVAERRLDQSEHLEPGDPGVELSADRLVTSLVPVTRVVISGGGPIAAALEEAFGFIGWQPSVFGDVGAASGLMATLSPIDAVVVMGHDVETAGRGLEAALKSKAGYIASIGSPRMQELREDWLA
jgi:xanthine dehydrogenase accessory factor